MSSVIQNFLDEFTKNYIQVLDMDEAVTETGQEYHDWELEVLQRSASLRTIFKNNEEKLAPLKDEMAQKLTDEEALELYQAVHTLYKGAYDDLYVFRIICEPLIKFYEEKQDIEKVVFLHIVMAFENYELYGRIVGGNKYIESTVEHLESVVEMSDRYGDLKDSYIRARIVVAFSNMIAPVGLHDNLIRQRAFDLYRKSYDLYEKYARPMNDVTEDAMIRDVDTSLLQLKDWLNDASPEDIALFTLVVVKLENNPNFRDVGGDLFRARKALDFATRKITAKQLLDDEVDYICNLPDPDYTEEDQSVLFYSITNFYDSAAEIFRVFDKHNIPREEQVEYAKRFVPIVTKQLTKVSIRFMPAEFNEICAQWFSKAARFIPDFEDKRKLLMQMILCRQPYTYIHSKMVQKLSVTIARTMVGRGTTFFDSVPLKPGDDIINFVAESAIMHDLGKCGISEVINKQSRKLSDFEFNIIREHPDKALQLIGWDPDFAAYADVMLGHHKTYDGKAGYPANFDNRASAIAPVIDLVAICDAMDAATDVYGRNYNPGKNFDSLFQELEQGRGTRYCPEIVDFIADTPDLYDELKDITQNRRGEIYYSVYQELSGIKAQE